MDDFELLDSVEYKLSGYEDARQLGFNDGYKRGFDDGVNAASKLLPATPNKTLVDSKLETFITDLLANLEDDIEHEMSAFRTRIAEILKKAIDQWANY
jgi:flagellar biosynthesis/type III secretory pathway protein FliH